MYSLCPANALLSLPMATFDACGVGDDLVARGVATTCAPIDGSGYMAVEANSWRPSALIRGSLSRGRILVVDDQPQIRRVLRTTLIANGYEVDDARGGQEALDKVRAQKYD